MSATQVLDRLAKSGVTPEARGGSLFLLPTERVTPEMVAEIRPYKAEVIAKLEGKLTALLERLCRGQLWITQHYDAYLAQTEPESVYVASLVEWAMLDTSVRRVYGYVGCVHGSGGRCSAEAPVICGSCAAESKGEW